MALKKLGLDFEIVGTSEIDKFAIISYASIHNYLDEVEIDYPSKEEMIDYLKNKNIGLDFKTKKVKLPRNLKELKLLYKACILSKCYGDISLLNTDKLPDIDLFTYSFPCQDYSIAGKQQGAIKGETRSGLIYECEKIIEGKKPKYLLLENVKNLVSKRFINDFHNWLDYLESLGYTNYWEVLNSKDYGIPQNRERVFVLSILNDENKTFNFPQKYQLHTKLKDLLETEVDETYYLSDDIQKRFKPNANFEMMYGNIVGTTAPDFRTIGQRDLVYQENSIMGALVATDYKQPKQIIEVKRIGGCFDTENSIHQAGSVYDQEGLSPTLDSMQGGYRQPCIISLGQLECEGWYRVDKEVYSTEELGVCVETHNRAKYIEFQTKIFTKQKNTCRNPNYINKQVMPLLLTYLKLFSESYLKIDN